MELTEDALFAHALHLPDIEKESLAVRLVEYLETHADAEIERAQLDLAKARRDELRSGVTTSVDGPSVLAKARKLITE